mgnify:CR=1 FL=1|tara:strand:- start:2523 stop:3803 length:1281 start_codon:yes stop_codon:yes gene_type:complete
MPTNISVNFFKGNANDTTAKSQDIITLEFETNTPIKLLDVTFMAGGDNITDPYSVSYKYQSDTYVYEPITDLSSRDGLITTWQAYYTVNTADFTGANSEFNYKINYNTYSEGDAVFVGSESIVFDNGTTPVVTVISLTDALGGVGVVKLGDTIKLSFNTSELLQTYTPPTVKFKVGDDPNNVTPLGDATVVAGASGLTYTATYQINGDSNYEQLTGLIYFEISNIIDTTGNPFVPTQIGNGLLTLSMDNKPPTMAIKFDASVKTSSTQQTTSDRNIKLVFISSEDTSNFTIDDITVTISGGTGIAGVLSNFNGSGKIYTAYFAPSYDKTYTVSVPIGVFTDGVGNPINIMPTFIFTYDGIAENIKLAKRVANWHYYNLHDEYFPGVPTEAPVETATVAFRKSLVPAAKIEYDKIMMKAFHKTMNTP